MRDIVEQVKHLTRDIEQKSQETTIDAPKDIHEDKETCGVVILQSGKLAGAQKDKGLLENKEVEDHDEVQGDGGQLVKSVVMKDEPLIKEDGKEKSLEEQLFVDNSAFENQGVIQEREKKEATNSLEFF